MAKKIKDLRTLCSLTFSQSGRRPERLEEALRRAWGGTQVGPGHAEEEACVSKSPWWPK